MRPDTVRGRRTGVVLLTASLATAACSADISPSGARQPTEASIAGGQTAAPAAATGQQPLPDNATGNRIRVMFTQPCPADSSGAVGVENPGAPDLDRTLVPPGSPTGGRLCKYGEPAEANHGNDAVRSALTRHLLLNSATAGRLAAAASQVSLAHSDTAVYHCPADFGTTTVIVLSYPGRPDIDLWQTDSGCTYLANGHIRASGGLSEALLWGPPSPSP